MISTLVYTETRDNLTYSTLTNCEANIKKRLISPKSFEFISDKVGESNLEKYNYKYLTDFSKNLIRNEGYGAKEIFVTVDYYSKNRMNAEIKDTAYCIYTMLHKDDYNHKPRLASVTVGDQTIDTNDTAWILNSVRMSSTKKTDIFFNKIKLLGKNISKVSY